MRFTAKYLFLLIFCLALFSTTAFAGGYLVIVDVEPGADIKAIARAFDGKVLDALSGGTYLLELKRLTPAYPLTGVISAEWDDVVRANRAKGGVVAVKPGTTADWYAAQPALK